MGALGEHKGQTQVSDIVLLLKVHSSNLETSLVSQRFRSFHYRSWSIRVDECNCGIIAICVHKLGFGHSVLHRVDNVLARVDKILFSLLDRDGVAMPILVLQIVGGAINDETAIDHDRNLVAELLSFIHTMCREQDRCILHLLDHSI